MKDILIDFGLPALILAMLFTLLITGIDGEVKTLMSAVVGWVINSGIHKARKK